MANDQRKPHRPSGCDEVTVYYNKAKVVGWLILGGVLTGAGAVVTLGINPVNHDSGAGIIGLVYTVIMGCVTVISLLRLFTAAPRLVVNHEGICINSKLLGVGTIEWGEISGFIAYPAPMQTRLAIVLADPRSILARQHWPQRIVYLLLKGNLMTSDVIVTSDNSLQISTGELLGPV